MKSLGINWFIDGRVDFEYKKYILLDYLQQIQRHFDDTRLYPTLSDLVFHYNNLLHFKQNKTTLQNAFPQRLAEADLAAVRLTYEKIVEDDETMREIEQIVAYAMYKMDPAIKIGREIFNYVESRLNISPVGILPIMPYSGYFSLKNGSERTHLVYEYHFTIFEDKDDKYRGINVKLIDTYEAGLAKTPEALKLELIRKNKHLPNPAVYYVHTDVTFPLEHTLLPVTKRCLVKFISDAA